MMLEVMVFIPRFMIYFVSRMVVLPSIGIQLNTYHLRVNGRIRMANSKFARNKENKVLGSELNALRGSE